MIRVQKILCKHNEVSKPKAYKDIKCQFSGVEKDRSYGRNF